MSFDTFSAGTELGCLRSKNDIKLLICYLLSNVEEGLTKDDIVKVLQENSLANYFDAINAFSELVSSNNISLCKDKPEKYCVTETGRMISTQLDISLPLTVRQKALSTALSLLAKDKIEQENQVFIEPTTNGYNVTCHISGGEIDLMSFSLYVPDIMQANLVKKNFHNNPEVIYRCMLSLVTQNKELTSEILKEVLDD